VPGRGVDEDGDRTGGDDQDGGAPGHRGEARDDINPRVARLPTDLFRNELFRARTPPSERVLAEITDEVFLPLVRR
jgi:hypothetical protein